jgi:hypothetical protein
MKTNILPLIAFLAAIAAVALVPVSAAAACGAFTVTGLLATLVADYGRNRGTRPTMAPVLAFMPARAAVGRAA